MFFETFLQGTCISKLSIISLGVCLLFFLTVQIKIMSRLGLFFILSQSLYFFTSLETVDLSTENNSANLHCFAPHIYTSIASFLCFSEISCRLQSIVYNDNSGELKQREGGGQLYLRARGNQTTHNLFEVSYIIKYVISTLKSKEI